MRALKLVQHMTDNADFMSEALIQKIRSSDRCSDLLRKVPAEEQKRSALEIYRDLTDWLGVEADSPFERRYVDLGIQRAHQGVPLNQVFWAVCIAREYLWEYIQQECLLDEPVEFWGGMMMLRSLDRFFDRSFYFTLVGYQKAGKHELAA